MTDKQEKINEQEKVAHNKTLNLQQKFVEIRKLISESASTVFDSLNDIYQILLPAMCSIGVNFEIAEEEPARTEKDSESGYYSIHALNDSRENHMVWVYESILAIEWINADRPKDITESYIHAIGISRSGPDAAKSRAWESCMMDYLSKKFFLQITKINESEKSETREKSERPKKKDHSEINGSGQNGAARHPLTDAQLNRMYRKGEDAGYHKESINEMIRKQYGQANPHMMTRTQYDDMCRYLDEKKKGESKNVQPCRTPGTVSPESRN